MNKIQFLSFILLFFAFISCSNDDDLSPQVNTPDTYSFERNGESTVSFDGQTTRIKMSEELVSAFLDFNHSTTTSLINKFVNENNPFSEVELNESDKNIRNKTAASTDYFSANQSESALIKADFENWINHQINDVFPSRNTVASQGQAGQLADGSSTRYVNAKGLEYNQAFGKSLIGALMVDQALNNYLSKAVLDADNNMTNNDNSVLVVGQYYTEMEHKWDEAYGYLYGTSVDAANPNATIGEDDSFLNKYIGRVESDQDFAGIAADLFDAFKLGRAAIVEKNYDVRDEQAEIIRELVSKVIAIRAVYYLQSAKNATELGGKFHDLSEGYGFIYSLQFTRMPNTNSPYFSKSEVDTMLNDLMADDGFWTVSDATLDTMSANIADRFDFTVEQTKN